MKVLHRCVRTRATLIAAVVVLVCVLAAAGCNWSTSPKDEEKNIHALRFFPSEVEIEGLDEIATVDVMVDKASALITARFTVGFDPEYVEVTKVLTDGYDFFLSDAGADIYEIENTIDNENGRVTVGIGALEEGFKGAKGSGTIAIITFRSKKTGESPLQFITDSDESTMTTYYSTRAESGWVKAAPAKYNGTIVVKEKPAGEESGEEE